MIIALWACGALYLMWWVGVNPLPDGFQNEYLLVGNALDLWGALCTGDFWHMRWYMYTGYWPWGLYAAPWPLMLIMGAGRQALVMGNLIHLAVLLVAVNSMGRAVGGRVAPLLVLLCPGVFGTLVRFEPNMAAISWTAAGLAALIASQGLQRRRFVWLYGASLGVGLMMDRLTVAFFLLPALLPLLRTAGRRGWMHLAQAAGITVLIAGAYYREFFLRHSFEIMSQANGVLAESSGLLSWLYYPLTLLDSQAGPVLGIVLILGLIGPMSKARSVLLASVVGGLVFFTVVSKNQVFYTLPILAPLAALASTRSRLAWVGVLGGVWGFLAVGVGVVPGGPWMPETWVTPRHTLARPPIAPEVDLGPAVVALGDNPKGISVLSEAHHLYEGFLLLAVREQWPDATVRGVVTDPQGTFEQFHEMDAFLWVGPEGSLWPTSTSIIAEMEDDHMDVQSMPPAPRVVQSGASDFVEVGRWNAGHSKDLVVFHRR
jgi:hypothetical protein